MQPHDKFFRLVFSDPENARGELQAVLPAEVSAQIDWSTLRHEPGTFVEPALAEQRTDLLFSVKRSGRDAYLYLPLEHQSRADRLMALRLLGYLVRIWEKHRTDNPDAKKLPPILPIVVYHDEREWSPERSFEGLIDLADDDVLRETPYLVRFEYLVDDLSRLSEEELRARAMTAFAKVAIVCLQRARDTDDMTDELKRWWDALHEVFRATNGVEALRAIVSYILHSTETPRARLDEVVRVLGTTAKEDVMTGAEMLMAEGKADSILRVLAARKVPVTDVERERILTCKEFDQLHRWIDRAVIVSAASELFAD